jgi:RNA polymerase sigma-32 factor
MTDPILSYISAVRRIPKMSREREHDLAVAARSGDADAAREILQANLRHVVSIALKYKGYRHVSLGDLIGQGNLGLLHALRKFEPNRKKRFVTYAAHWARAYMLQYIMRTSAMVGGGAFRSAYFFSFGRSRDAAIRQTEGDVDAAMHLLAAKYRKDVETIRRLDGVLDHRDTSLDTTPAHGVEPGSSSMLERLPSDVPSPLEIFEQKSVEIDMSADIWRAVCRLDDRERAIVVERIMADDPVTLQHLGNRFGCSRERVRQIEERAKQKLREALDSLDDR